MSVSSSALSVARRASEFALRVARALGFVAPLLTRLLIGQAFFLTGRGKSENLEGVTSFFADLGIPFPELNAFFVAHLEYFGGIALILGLLTRLAATGLATTMVVALMTADRANFLTALASSGDVGLTDVVPVVYLLFLIWLMLYGPGLVSVDALISRRLGFGDTRDSTADKAETSSIDKTAARA